jgi:hypothetical protein
MAEASKENARLAERLLTIGTLLRDGAPPPAKANGGDREEWLPPDSVITGATMEAILKMIARSVGAELHALTQRIAALEARKHMGVFDPLQSYLPGQTCTHGGSLWTCKSATTGVRPESTGSSDVWLLTVKHGRDGRDKR